MLSRMSVHCAGSQDLVFSGMLRRILLGFSSSMALTSRSIELSREPLLLLVSTLSARGLPVRSVTAASGILASRASSLAPCWWVNEMGYI